ncbi:HEAT repeat domain-containing protein [Janthinobacterium sp. SUN118]|nr:HEAT repeat domain-containing protein [Janthinobacterium sp. SUN118]
MHHALSTAVNAFRRWASERPVDERSGEWECDYAKWPEINAAFLTHIKTGPPHASTAGDIADLLYAIGRDNETAYLVRELAGREDWFLFLLPHALAVNDPDVKWQFAVQLGVGAFPFVAAESALLKLVQDEHEYVRRMALQGLGRMASPHAEPLCVRAWESNHEYQRIMVLWVLKELKSRNLHEYILLAKADGRQFLMRNVAEIENGMAPSDSQVDQRQHT